MSESKPHDPADDFDPLEHLSSSSEGEAGDSPAVFEGLTGNDFGGMDLGEDEPAAPIVRETPLPRTHAEPAVKLPPKPPARRPVATSSGPVKASGIPAFVTALATAGVMLGGAYGLSMMLPPKADTPATPPTAPAVSLPDATAATTLTPAPAADATKGLAEKVDALEASLSGLTKSFDEVKGRFAAMPKPAPGPDLKPIETKLADLAKRLDEAPAPTADAKAVEAAAAKADAGIADLSKKLEAVLARADAMEKALAAEKAEVAALGTKLKDPAESTPKPGGTTPVTAPPAPAPAGADDEIAKAADLFKKQQYPQAKEAFAKLQASASGDARVFYYAAMLNGITTQQWTGETERLVTRGIELEKAGTPEAGKINAAFSDLSPSIKPWLDAYRARAAR